MLARDYNEPIGGKRKLPLWRGKCRIISPTGGEFSSLAPPKPAYGTIGVTKKGSKRTSDGGTNIGSKSQRKHLFKTEGTDTNKIEVVMEEDSSVYIIINPFIVEWRKYSSYPVLVQ